MTKQLSFKQRILVAGTLFGMFFGAGNLIFPVHLGQLAGKNVLPAITGFIITAVGIPILGVAAIGNTHSDGLHALSSKLGKGYGYVFTCLLYLTIGPFFAIPRCATVSFTTGVQPMLGENINPSIALLIFSFIFFGLVLFFSLRPGNITLWIGKLINPLFLIFFSILVITALVHPGTAVSSVTPVEGYENTALSSSLIEGYGTMDAIAGLAFGIVVITIIRDMGVKEDGAVAKDVLISGIMTGLLMAVIYFVTILMGAQSRGLFEVSENGGITLAQIAEHYLGSFGSIILAITITFACLKTSLGLVTSCAEAFTKMFPKRFGYKTWAVIFTVFSFIISNFGLSTIIKGSLPVLMFLYPLTITLIILALCGKLFRHDKAVYITVTAFTAVPALLDLLKTLPENFQPAGLIRFASKILPLFDVNLGWIVPSVIGLVIGLVIHFVKMRSDKPSAVTV